MKRKEKYKIRGQYITKTKRRRAFANFGRRLLNETGGAIRLETGGQLLKET